MHERERSDPPSGEWFADETFWTELYPRLFPQARIEAASTEVERVRALSGVERGDVLDLCCGPGRHAVAFALAGYRVTGVDRSPFLLTRARQYAAASKAAIEWIQADMREFLRPAAFDLAVSLFTSFGYFDDPRENARVLERLRASLRPGGTLVMDLVGKEIIARRYAPSAVHDLEDGGIFIERRRVIDDWSRMENQWILVRDSGVRIHRFRHWIYSAREIRDLLGEAGFASVNVHGDLDGADYGPEARRLIVVARTAG